jgi:hypothetical protein
VYSYCTVQVASRSSSLRVATYKLLQVVGDLEVVRGINQAGVDASAVSSVASPEIATALGAVLGQPDRCLFPVSSMDEEVSSSSVRHGESTRPAEASRESIGQGRRDSMR